ncbi:MAG: hypothetical protein F6J87_14865 [Spirulina sp. SIO3F2]|nr:hypothetical protein [Spirulina sp. SIO3F2]
MPPQESTLPLSLPDDDLRGDIRVNHQILLHQGEQIDRIAEGIKSISDSLVTQQGEIDHLKWEQEQDRKRWGRLEAIVMAMLLAIAGGVGTFIVDVFRNR